MWARGPQGLFGFGFSPAVEALAASQCEDDLIASGPMPLLGVRAALGTIGGGNHFAELGSVAEVARCEVADQFALQKGGLVLLCHSGSRGLGRALAERWSGAVLSEHEATSYLSELVGAIRFARANRLLIAGRMLGALGITRASKVAGSFDVVHNSVAREHCRQGSAFVHRKGCAPAAKGQATVVLGSRGAPSSILCGRGNASALSSVAHGAGRKMQRSEAVAKVRAKYARSQLRTSKLGSVVICDESKLLYEEHPDAYKPVEPVVRSLIDAELADHVAVVAPLLTVKL